MTQSDMWNAIAILFFIIIDYITGIMKAIMQGNLSSEKMREGLGHKLAYLILTLVTCFINILDAHLSLGFPLDIFTCTAAGICLIELTSIIENITAINPELEKAAFMNVFAQNSTKPKHKED